MRYYLAIGVVTFAVLPGVLISAGLAARPALTAIAEPPDNNVSQGEALYLAHCTSCHGPTAVGYYMIPIPDLRRSNPAVIAQMDAILLDGVLEGAGMPSFKGRLTAKEIPPLKAYIAKRRLQLKQN